MDQKLPLRIRLGIKFHLMMCNLCLRYKKQLDLIQKAISEIDNERENSSPPSAHLPDKVRKTIKNNIENN